MSDKLAPEKRYKYVHNGARQSALLLACILQERHPDVIDHRSGQAKLYMSGTKMWRRSTCTCGYHRMYRRSSSPAQYSPSTSLSASRTCPHTWTWVGNLKRRNILQEENEMVEAHTYAHHWLCSSIYDGVLLCWNKLLLLELAMTAWLLAQHSSLSPVNAASCRCKFQSLSMCRTLKLLSPWPVSFPRSMTLEALSSWAPASGRLVSAGSILRRLKTIGECR